MAGGEAELAVKARVKGRSKADVQAWPMGERELGAEVQRDNPQ